MTSAASKAPLRREKLYACAPVDRTRDSRILGLDVSPAGALALLQGMEGYAREQLTDGIVPARFVAGLLAMLEIDPATVGALCSTTPPLLEAAGRSYRLTEFLKYNSSVEQVAVAREEARVRAADSRNRGKASSATAASGSASGSGSAKEDEVRHGARAPHVPSSTSDLVSSSDPDPEQAPCRQVPPPAPRTRPSQMSLPIPIGALRRLAPPEPGAAPSQHVAEVLAAFLTPPARAEATNQARASP